MSECKTRILAKLENEAPLKVVFLNDVGFQYGAGLAELRQIKSFLHMGHEVKALCWDAGERKTADLLPVDSSGRWRGLQALRTLHARYGQTPENIAEALEAEVAAEAPDVVIVGNLHAAGWPLEVFQKLRELDALTVAYAHDCYLFTGRCAYPGGCGLYLTGCSECCLTCEEYPPLKACDIAEAWELRRKIFCGPSGTPLATNSSWTLDFARSALGDAIDAEVVYLGLDTRLFRPMQRDVCRRLLGIPQEAFVILSGAVDMKDRRKGGAFFEAVVNRLRKKAYFLLFGTNSPQFSRVHTVGFVDDYRKMPLLYGAADLFLATSLEEAFGQTIMEASACGVPVAAFSVGGIPEVARDGVNARLAADLSEEALIEALEFFIASPRKGLEYGAAGRRLAEAEFSLERQGRRWNEYIGRLAAAKDRDRETARPGGEKEAPALSSPAGRKGVGGKGGGALRFCIVTPCLNAEAYIDEAVCSVLTQAGPFRIRYHIQDGGSRDGTLQRIKAWAEKLREGALPVLCQGIEFSFSTGSDKGMYDAINRGFAEIGPEDRDYMTWLNTDDRLLQGALATAGSLLGAFEGVKWLGGRPALMDRQGALTGIYDLSPYPRRSLRAGICDGRHWGFVMQEGTFWRADLWKKAGGLRSDLKLAGDFDLWRRFSEHADYVVADFPLALHRRRPGQLSESLDAYDAEVDKIVDQRVRDAEWERHQRAAASAEGMEAFGYTGKVLRFNQSSGKWDLRDETYTYRQLKPSVAAAPGLVARSTEVVFLSGLRNREVAYPNFALPAGTRWMIKPEAVLRVDCEEAGDHLLSVRCRSFHQRLLGSLTHEGRTVSSFEVPYTGHESDCMLFLNLELQKGENRLGLNLALENPAAGEPDLWILIIACELTPRLGISVSAP